MTDKQPSKEQELICKIVENWGNAACGIHVMEQWLREYANQEKVKLIWEMIEDWQGARDKDEDIDIPKFSFNDIEVELYAELEKIQPIPPDKLNQTHE